MYIHIYEYIYICIYLYIYIYIHPCIHKCTFYLFIYLFMYLPICLSWWYTTLRGWNGRLQCEGLTQFDFLSRPTQIPFLHFILHWKGTQPTNSENRPTRPIDFPTMSLRIWFKTIWFSFKAWHRGSEGLMLQPGLILTELQKSPSEDGVSCNLKSLDQTRFSEWGDLEGRNGKSGYAQISY